jgi:hypothetical protein
MLEATGLSCLDKNQDAILLEITREFELMCMLDDAMVPPRRLNDSRGRRKEADGNAVASCSCLWGTRAKDDRLLPSSVSRSGVDLPNMDSSIHDSVAISDGVSGGRVQLPVQVREELLTALLLRRRYWWGFCHISGAAQVCICDRDGQWHHPQVCTYSAHILCMSVWMYVEQAIDVWRGWRAGRGQDVGRNATEQGCPCQASADICLCAGRRHGTSQVRAWPAG